MTIPYKESQKNNTLEQYFEDREKREEKKKEEKIE